MYFEVVGEIATIETIAAGPSVRDQKSLQEQYGGRSWRKLKGVATVRGAGGRLRRAEVHWYEAHGVGRRRFKVKRFLEA